MRQRTPACPPCLPALRACVRARADGPLAAAAEYDYDYAAGRAAWGAAEPSSSAGGFGQQPLGAATAPAGLAAMAVPGSSFANGGGSFGSGDRGLVPTANIAGPGGGWAEGEDLACHRLLEVQHEEVCAAVVAGLAQSGGRMGFPHTLPLPLPRPAPSRLGACLWPDRIRNRCSPRCCAHHGLRCVVADSPWSGRR